MAWRPPTLWWSVVFVASTLGLQWLPGAALSWQFARPAYAAGAWWQLLTAQWVHFGTVHAAVNALGLVVLLRAFEGLVDGRLQALALLGGYAGVAVVIALDPACTTYAGASGALHGLLAGSAGAMLLLPPTAAPSSRTRTRLLGVCLTVALAVKLLVQHVSVSTTAPGWLGFLTYYPAHEAGASGGLLTVALAWVFQRYRTASPGAGG